MVDFDNPIDPPAGWTSEHVAQYVRTDGAQGHHWRGVTTLLLTSIGHRSGQARRTPLIYGRYGEEYVIVASKGGSDTHPAWYRNLAAQPRVRLQVGARRFEATARTATPAEKAQRWPVMTGLWPAYDDYQAATERDIPLVILTPA